MPADLGSTDGRHELSRPGSGDDGRGTVEPQRPPAFDTGGTPADRMRAHASDREHLYGFLMRAMADDWEAGGVVRHIWRGWDDAPPGSAIQLRLLAGLFRIVLTGRAPDLVDYYPCLGGQLPPEQAWPRVRAVMADHVTELNEALSVPPQTNEVARSTPLLIGIFDAVRRSGLSRVRLLEPGASAGLNLLLDEFRYTGDGWSFGPADSPLTLANAVSGSVLPTAFEIVERRGCDLSPVDATSAQGRLRLRSFVWPFHLERHERLGLALEIAARHPVEVDAAPAADWVAQQLSRPPAGDDVLTVVWQSITRLYWPPEQTERVRAAVAAARQRMPLAHVSMEYPSAADQVEPELVVEGPLGPARRLGMVADHGIPVTLLDEPMVL